MMLISMIKRIFLAAATCVFALGGAGVGCMAGAIIGSTTESGFGRGCAVGVVSGVIVALELFDSLMDGRFISKVSKFGTSLINGKVFVEWVYPAMLKASQSQTFFMPRTELEDSDFYNIDDGPRGLAPEMINKLPTFQVQMCQNARCTICLEDFRIGETGSELSNCRHCFHKTCIDEWLAQRASCPVCRQLLQPPVAEQLNLATR